MRRQDFIKDNKICFKVLHKNIELLKEEVRKAKEECK